jgi:hypothetical protein
MLQKYSSQVSFLDSLLPHPLITESPNINNEYFARKTSSAPEFRKSLQKLE